MALFSPAGSEIPIETIPSKGQKRHWCGIFHSPFHSPKHPSSWNRMIDVVAGLIVGSNHEVLACQRPPEKHLGGKWEFPGGKVEPGETPEEALIRELEEELGITVNLHRSLSPVIHDYGRGPIRLIPYICAISRGHPQAREHSELRWCPPTELPDLDWATADLPILNEFLASHPPE